MSLPKLLWVGDAVAHTGFSQVTRNVLAGLVGSWEIHVLGVNYKGDPHDYPYRIYPANLDGDQLGFKRLLPLCQAINPDVILLLSDWWHIPHYLEQIPAEIPVVAYIPVDGKGLDPEVIQHLNLLRCAIFYTRFGLREAHAAGFTGKGVVIPHGVDCETFRPMDKLECRRKLNLESVMPLDAFLFGNINRNQPRKRMDLTIEAFARAEVPNSFLYLHCQENPKDGYKIHAIAHKFGVHERVIVPRLKTSFHGVEWEELPLIYNCLDCQVTTTMGEGWGLTTMEGMACGVPQIIPKAGALYEWANDAVMAYRTNGMELNRASSVWHWRPDALDLAIMMQHESNCVKLPGYRDRIRAHVNRLDYRWPHISKQFDQVLREVLQESANGQQ